MHTDKKSKARDLALAKLAVLALPRELPLTAARGDAGFSFFVEKIKL